MPKPPPTDFNPLAGLATLIVPGAGHVLLGRPRRGLFAAIGVLGLFFFGLLIGGIDAIDSREDRVWFIGQAFVGAPTIIADEVHERFFKAHDLNANTVRSGFPGERRIKDSSGRYIWQPLTESEIASGLGPPNTPGLGRINEIAMLSIVLAGMLNLIVFLDALMPSPEPRSKPAGASTKEAAGLAQTQAQTQESGGQS